MAHASRSAARRHRRALAVSAATRNDPLPDVELLHRGKPAAIKRTRGNPRLDLFLYDGDEIVGLTTLAKATGWSFP